MGGQQVLRDLSAFLELEFPAGNVMLPMGARMQTQVLIFSPHAYKAGFLLTEPSSHLPEQNM